MRRFLVLGLDGGTFDLLDPLMKAGEMPFLRSLRERGFSAPLLSVYPAKTIPAWYSFATGLDPGSLGIFGFTEPDGGPGKSRIVQSFRPAEAMWDILSRRGLRVGVLNFPIRGAYPVNGFLVPGMLAERPTTYPANAREIVEGELGEPAVPELPAYRGSERAHWMAEATRGVDQRGRSAKVLCDRFRPDFLFVLFRETDRVQHQHWTELTGRPDAIGDDLLGFYREVDAACQQIDQAFRAVGGPAVTLVISDHGHGSARSDFFVNRWLQQEGYLSFCNGGDSARRRMVARALLFSDRFKPTRAILRPVVDRLRGGTGPTRIGRALAGQSSFEEIAPRIDWKRTLAYSYPVPEGVYLNRYNPSITPEQGRELTTEIRQKLEAYPDAHVTVFEPREIYQGRNLANAPALLLNVDDLETEIRMDFAYPSPLLRQRPGFFYGSGVHRMAGILLAAGDGVTNARAENGFSLLDIAPTVLDGMGLKPPSGMSGRSLRDRLFPGAG